MINMINIALPKGRLGAKIAGLLDFDFDESSRQLIFVNEAEGLRCFWVKPFDVPVYVERGVADVGIAGRDILLERKNSVYELTALNAGKCRMCVCAKKDFADSGMRTLRVATEFPNIARDYYSGQGREIDLITLRGSLELAPLLGLSDVIVDIVETGKTLRANNLEVTAVISEISARFIANKSTYKFKRDKIDELVRRVSELDQNNQGI